MIRLVAVALLGVAAGVAAGVVTPASPARAGDDSIVARLTVHNPSDARVQRWPLTAGVPVPIGMVKTTSGLALRRSESQPVQARVMSRWPDGSARWLLIDSQLDLGERERRTVELVAGTGRSSTGSVANPVSLVDSSEGITIRNGLLSVAIPREGANLLEIRRGAAESPPWRVRDYVSLAGQRQATTGKREVEVLEHGPLRVRVSVRGRHASLRYEVRVDIFAGSSLLRVQHSLENHSPSDDAGLEQFGIALLGDLPGDTWSAGVEQEDPLIDKLHSSKSTTVAQVDSRRFFAGRMAAGETGKLRRGRLAGWFQAGDVGLSSRFFWQQLQSISIDRDRLDLAFYRGERGGLALGQGAAKTHEVVFDFDATPARLSAASRAPFLVVDPRDAWAAGALRNTLPPTAAGRVFQERLGLFFERYLETQDTEKWDDSGAVACSKDLANTRTGAYGMLHFGDWNFKGLRDDIKGCDAWGNLEYDTAQVMALGFVATGDVRYRDQMVASSRHFMDVDRIHFSARHPTWVGMNHPKNPLHFTFELGGVDLGHTWNEGLITYGLLTGDERALRAAREIADYLVRRQREGITFRGNPRQWGWPAIALVAAFELTGDDKYREAARWYARRGAHTYAPEELSQWKLGILAEGIAYADALSDEKDLRDWLRRYAGAVEEKKPNDGRFYPAVAYMGATESNSGWRKLADAKVEQLRFGAWGKPLTISARIGFAILGARP